MDFTLNNKSSEKHISLHIKNLPNELINVIFSYVSLVPFNKKELMSYIIKKELMSYITNHKAYYTNTRIYDLLAFDRNDLYLNNPQYLYSHCIGRTRINEDIWNYEFFQYNRFIMKRTFMYDVKQCKFFNKSQCYYIIRKEISKDIFKKIVLKNNISNRYISRLKLNELRTIVFTYLYRYN